MFKVEQCSTTIIPEERSSENIEGQQEQQSSLNSVSHYEELKEESANTNYELYSQIQTKDQSQPKIISTIDSKEKTFNLVVLEPNIKSTKSVKYFKASQVKIKLDQINVAGKIDLYKRTREINFIYLDMAYPPGSDQATTYYANE